MKNLFSKISECVGRFFTKKEFKRNAPFIAAALALAIILAGSMALSFGGITFENRPTAVQPLPTYPRPERPQPVERPTPTPPVLEVAPTPVIRPVNVPIPPEPLSPREGAVMPPEQGGAMLYAFRSEKPYFSFTWQGCGYDGPQEMFYYGLTNDLGETVATPRYHVARYTFDRYGRISGVIAILDTQVYLYDLYGAAQALPFKATDITPVFDGRHLIVRGFEVETLDNETRFLHGTHGGKTGLFDALTNEWAIVPQENLRLENREHILLGFDTERTYSWTDEDGYRHYFDRTVGSFIVGLENTDERKHFPENWTNINFVPELGWFSVTENQNRSIFADADLNQISKLNHYRISSRGFNGKNHMIVQNMRGSDYLTFLNREGEILEKRFNFIDEIGDLFLANNTTRVEFEQDREERFLLDDSLNILHEIKEDERIIGLRTSKNFDRNYSYWNNADLVVLTNIDIDEVLNAWCAKTGAAVSPYLVSGSWRNGESIFTLENGSWSVVHINDPDEPVWRRFVFSNENSAIVTWNTHYEEPEWTMTTHYKAIDMQGKKLDHHPLLSFFENYDMDRGVWLTIDHHSQFLWIEGERRGFIDNDGNWLIELT